MSFNASTTPTVGLTTSAAGGSNVSASATASFGGARSNYKDIYDLLERLCKSFVGAKDNHSKLF